MMAERHPSTGPRAKSSETSSTLRLLLPTPPQRKKSRAARLLALRPRGYSFFPHYPPHFFPYK